MRRSISAALSLLILVFSVVGQAEPKLSVPVIFAEFGKISAKDRTAKVKAFHKALEVCDGRKGLIYNYGTVGEIKARKNALMKDWRECDAFNCVRFLFMDFPNKRDTKTVLWIVPLGVENPTP